MGHNSNKNFRPGLIFELAQDIIELKLLYKFYLNRMRNKFARALTSIFCQFSKLKRDITPTKIFGQDSFSNFVRDIIKLKLLYKFYSNRMRNKFARVLTSIICQFSKLKRGITPTKIFGQDSSSNLLQISLS